MDSLAREAPRETQVKGTKAEMQFIFPAPLKLSEKCRMRHSLAIPHGSRGEPSSGNPDFISKREAGKQGSISTGEYLGVNRLKSG